jgi:hypothetical protein
MSAPIEMTGVPMYAPSTAPVQTLKTFSTTGGEVDWRDANDLVLVPGLRGALFGIHWREAGRVTIFNTTTDKTFVYKTVRSSGTFGPWMGDPETHLLAPGNQVKYEASWDASTAFHVFSFTVRASAPDDSSGSEGKPHTMLDDVMGWIGRNWIPITVVGVATVVTVKFVGPGLKTRISGEGKKK